MRELITGRRVAGACLVLALLTYAALWPLLARESLAGSDYRSAGSPPSWTHLMGTDSLGHDLGLQVAEALRASLAIASGSALLATLIGVLVGASAAAGGARVDAVLMRFTDAVAAVPHLLATIVVVALFRGSITAIVLALAATHWPTVARIVRAESQKVMASKYVAATRVAGAGTGAVVRHHVLPAVAGQAGLAVVLMIPHAVWHESTLSFLGIGLPPERPSLGTLVAMAQSDLLVGRWWPLAFPTAVLIVITVAAALLGPRGDGGGHGRGAGRRPRRQVRGTVAAHDDRAGGLVIEDLTVTLQGRRHTVTAVDHVSLRVTAGHLVALVGRSGAGKSTLLNTCSGLAPGDATISGRIRVAGPVGHVPQSAACAFTPTRHVRDQLAEGLSVGRAEFGGASMDVAHLCHLVGIDPDLTDRYPHQLSGGQCRRMAVAAALSTCPTVLLVDEPTSGLDQDAAEAIFLLLRRLADEAGIAVLVATHDVASLTATGAADEVVGLRDGRLTTAETAS